MDGRVGFRDIYRAVTESEVRVTAAIERATAPINVAVADHEIRIRAIEAGAAGVPAANAKQIIEMKTDLDRIEMELSNAAAINGRRAADFSVAQKTLVTIIIVSNFILGLVVMFSTLISESATH